MNNRVVVCLFIVAGLSLGFASAQARLDTVRRDNGVAAITPSLKDGWEESIIISVNEPCTLKKVLIYYVAGTGPDLVRVTGDASEGTIPPTQYCFPYNTLAEQSVTVTGKGWVEIDFSRHNVVVDGYDRIVLQHVVTANGPHWGQDNNGQSPVTSFQYDPVTPNPNFFSIPGIFYQARGDYMVRLVVEKPFDMRPTTTMIDVTSSMGLLGSDGKALRSDQVTVVDWNDDGYDDICIPGQFFQNDSGRGFARITMPFSSGPTAWGDVDNDGDLDVFVMRGFGSDELYRNDGKGVFTNVTKASGLVNAAPAVTALWLDIEQDGDLDLFIANGRSTVNGNEVYYQDKLFRNDGSMSFTDITNISKIAVGEPAPYYDTWGASLCDYNNDGRTDIFVATYRLAPDRLYRNNGDGTFAEVSSSTGALGTTTTQPQYFGHGMGSEWGDINRDGLVDLFVGNLGHPDSRAQYSNPSLVLRNTATAANPRFTNWYEMSSDGILDWHGIKFKEMNAGFCLADLDHDGSLDVWHGQISYDAFGSGANRPAHLYLGSTNPTTPFRDITWESGMFIHGAWTAVRTDVDRDGDLDLICASGTENVKVFRNELPKEGSSITIRLRDTRPGAQRRAYGARLTLVAGGSQIHRWLPGTVNGGRMSQMTDEIHIGIGSAERIDSVTVVWPGNLITRHSGLRPHTIVELTSDGKQSVVETLRPANLRPANGSIGLGRNDELAWTTSSAAPVTVEITPVDVAGSTPILRNNVSGSRMPIDLPNGLYAWRVISGGSASEPWILHVGDPVPQRPSLLAPRLNAQDIPTTTTILWTRSRYDLPGTFATQYHVTLRRAPSMSMIIDTIITDTTISLRDLPAGTAVTGWIHARYRSARATDSVQIAFATYAIPQAPLAIFPANNAMNVTTRPRFQWSRPANVDKGFEIEVDTLASFMTATLRRASDTSLTWTPPLKPGRTYHWRARGSNLAGPGEWSSTATFVTAGTTSVIDDSGQQPCTGVIEIYDLGGRLIATFESSSPEAALHGVSGLVLVVSKTPSGFPCKTEFRWVTQ